jgi:hypothetical protein
MKKPPKPTPSLARWLVMRRLGPVAIAATLGCIAQPGEPMDETDPSVVEEHTSALGGGNLGGFNLGGVNLGGSNLGGANLGGANLGGVNLGGSNLGGSNLSGTNLGGNNLGGVNLGGSNLGGVNLGGSNLGGSNLGGSNLGGSNLGGSNLGGSNVAGNNLGGSNLGGSNLGGSNTGRNIHNLTGSINGMLYSAEDMWTPKTGQCIVMGIGSTAFPKLLGQQTANTKISVALGKLPWGFANSAGGPIVLRAWEAIVWGDKTYCVFVMAAPSEATWAGVAGFIKAVFRWNAPPAQTMEISGIEASAPHDPTLSTAITSYTGMMNAGAHFRSGNVLQNPFLAGELAFITATTNNQSVMVDFSSWVLDRNNNALVLGNVQSASPPTYAEALYVALDNGSGNISVLLDDAASRTNVMPAGMTNSIVDIDVAYLAFQAGLAPKPTPRRCGGALFLNAWFGEPVPSGKCDSGLTWTTSFCSTGSSPWSTVSGTTAPMNSYMQLTQPGGKYKRALVTDGVCGVMKPVMSETYVHMWERNYDLPGTACTAESNASFCSRWGRNCGAVTGTDNCGNARTVSSCGTCTGSNTCGGDGRPNMCGNATTKRFEAEGIGHTLNGSAVHNLCYEAFTKMIVPGADPGTILGACSGGARIRFIGNGSSNYVTLNNVNVGSAGTYTMTVYAMAKDPRFFSISVNGGATQTLNVQTPEWNTALPFTMNVSLNSGNNSIKFFNNSAYAPDLDRVVFTGAGTSCTPESNAAFCTRLAKNCGSVSGTDNCGAARTVSSCGTCTSPQTCGGGGTASVCGGGSGGGGTCPTAYAQANCLTYYAGIQVSSGGRKWTCANGNCMNCSGYASCAPGASGCPWGAVWTDGGTCN